MVWPSAQAKKVEIEKGFFPQKADLAGLMMGTNTFKIWPFWPVRCEPGGGIKLTF